MSKKNNYLYNSLNEGILDMALKFTNHFLDVIYTGQKSQYIKDVLKDDPILVKAIFDLNSTVADFTSTDFDIMKKFLNK